MENEIKETASKKIKKRKLISVILSILLVIVTSSLPVFYFGGYLFDVGYMSCVGDGSIVMPSK